MTWVPAEDDGTQWGYPLLNGQDWVYSLEGSVYGERQLVAPGGRTFDFRYFSHDDVKIELSDEAFASLGAFPRYMRSLGLGKLRKSHDAPLAPDADKIWVQSVHGDATLVTRPEGEEPAFFRLGHLGLSALRMTQMGMLRVLFFVGTDVLPDPTMRKEARASFAGRAWGGNVASTPAGSEGFGGQSAWELHAAQSPHLMVEGAEAARAALEQSRQQAQP